MKYEKMAIQTVDRMKESMKNFSQRGLAQFGMVKNSNRSRGHESSHFTLLPIPPAAEIHISTRDQRILIRIQLQYTVRLLFNKLWKKYVLPRLNRQKAGFFFKHNYIVIIKIKINFTVNKS